MTLDPIKFAFELSELPENYKNLSSTELNGAVSSFFSKYFREMGGEATVDIQNDYVIVQWFPNSLSDTENAIQEAIDLLNQGKISQGEAMLAALCKRFPDNPTILYNYGMILSEKGQLEEAIDMLSRLTEIDPEANRAWNALAVAHFRAGKRTEAISELKKSYQLNSEDPYTLRNLGGLLAKESTEQAHPYLEKAASLLPDDPQAQYGYGKCLKDLGHYDEADPVLKKVIELSPYSDVAERAKEDRNEIASIKMKSKAGSEPRMDAVMYCFAALEKFNEMDDKKKQAVTYEIAMLGRNGFDLEDSEQKYTLNSLPGKFTGMQLVSYMFVGLKELDPNLDPGINLEDEYNLALEMFNKKTYS